MKFGDALAEGYVGLIQLRGAGGDHLLQVVVVPAQFGLGAPVKLGHHTHKHAHPGEKSQADGIHRCLDA